VVAISVLLAVLGIVNNLFGFTGITAFARYLVAPVMIVWMLYLVVKGVTDLPSSVWTTGPAGGATVPLLTGVGIAIGSVMWGNELQNGFFTVAGWSAIAVPSTTVVMCADQFVLPRLGGARRPTDTVPSWRDAALANWPAIVAVLAAMLFGAWGLQLFPGQTSAPALGLVPVEAWLIAGVVYLVLSSLTIHRGRRDDRTSQSTA
jgi:purine-cytosine permease-like protein